MHAASLLVPALEHADLQARPGQVGGRAETVVAPSDYHRVVASVRHGSYLRQVNQRARAIAPPMAKPPAVRSAAQARWFRRAFASGGSFIRLWTCNGKNGFLRVERTRRPTRRCSTRGFVSPCSSRVSPRYGPTIEASSGGRSPSQMAISSPRNSTVTHAPKSWAV